MNSLNASTVYFLQAPIPTLSALIGEGVTDLDSNLQYIIKTEVSNALTSVAKWLDCFEGPEARRAEVVRSMMRDSSALEGLTYAVELAVPLRNN